MRFVQVVLGLPVEGPFDYSVPVTMRQAIQPGCRVWINFRNKKEVGFVVGLRRKTAVAAVKPVLGIIDEHPLLDRHLLKLTEELADYYCCSRGQAIETALPAAFRLGRPCQPGGQAPAQETADARPPQPEVIFDREGTDRWPLYLDRADAVLAQGRSVIVLLPDKLLVQAALMRIRGRIAQPVEELQRTMPQEARVWERIRSHPQCLVIGTRSALFAPVNRLGLIIVDEEADYGYKQDQVPHYHAREAALMRAALEKAHCILGSTAPSLESWNLAKKKLAGLRTLERRRAYPLVSLIDMKNIPAVSRRQSIVLSKFMQDAIALAVQTGEKVLVFLNRKGFATAAVCNHCGAVLKCPRCAVNLVYHFQEQKLRCHYCAYTLQPPAICPSCASGYIRFTGAGTEKVESELARIFPQARIREIDVRQPWARESADIFIATQAVIRQPERAFDLICALAVDNSLNHVDFRAAEKTFAVLCGLAALTEKRIVVQSNYRQHYCFTALADNTPEVFYREELRQRKQFAFPPVRHFVAVKVRGRDEERARAAAEALRQRLQSPDALPVRTDLLSLLPGQPPKLRGYYYWTILLSTEAVRPLSAALKLRLKESKHSGIIITVDVDPVF
jgi:primosomal protein N' (replication factor Y)